MLSTLFTSDPTLTVENVHLVMEKVEPTVKMQVWESVTEIGGVIMEIKEMYSTDSERETAYVDTYVNCDPWASWENLAKKLYQHQQVAAIEEVRSYLPPRGEPCFWSACIYLHMQEVSIAIDLRKG